MALALDAINVFNRKSCDIVYEQVFKVSPTCSIASDGATVHLAEPLQLRLTLRVQP